MLRTPHLTCQILYYTAATNKFHPPKQNCKNKRSDQDKATHSVHNHSTHPVGHSRMDSEIILQKVLLTNRLLLCGLYIYLTWTVVVTFEEGSKKLGSIQCLEILE